MWAYVMAYKHPHDDPEHEPEHGHALGAHGGPLANTSLGQVELSVFETNVPPRFRLYFRDANGNPIAPPAANKVTLETIRPGKNRQLFKFKRQDDCVEATTELPEPHEFKAVLKTQGLSFESVRRRLRENIRTSKVVRRKVTLRVSVIPSASDFSWDQERVVCGPSQAEAGPWQFSQDTPSEIAKARPRCSGAV